MDTSIPRWWLPPLLLLHLIIIILFVAQTVADPDPAAHHHQPLRRRRPLDHQHAVTAHPLGDQIALANTWTVPNRVISATYAGNLDTGHVSQSNVVVNVLPGGNKHQRNHRFTDADLANAESLANTRTAAEYVTKAMQMRGTKSQPKSPQSSYIKYDVFSNQEEKQMMVSSPSSSSSSGGGGGGAAHNMDNSGSPYEADDDDDAADDGGVSSDKPRYVISEQITSHQPHRSVAPTAPTTAVHKPSMSQHHQRAPPHLAATRSSQHFETPAPDSYAYNPRKPDYSQPPPPMMMNNNHSKPKPPPPQQHRQSAQHPPQPPPQLYNSYGTPYAIDDDAVADSYYPQPTELPRSEMIKHIQHSVLRYMQELEAEGRFKPPTTTSTSTTTTTTTPAPPVTHPAVEIKTYYRIPAHHSTSAAAAHDAINKYHYGMGRGKSTYPKMTTAAPSLPMDYYRTPSSSSSSGSDMDDSYFPASYTTASSNGGIESYPATTMSSITYHQHSDTSGEISTPHIDLTFRSKSRPKPIDLAALDVGQSWSHDAEPSHAPVTETNVYYRYPASSSSSGKHHAASKPLHFSPQTYHDINSMTYAAGGNQQQHQSSPGYGYGPDAYASVTSDDTEQTPVRFKDEPASAVVQYHEPVSADELLNDVQQHYRAPIHIINGIPVANPYKFNVEQLRQMFGGGGGSNNNDDVKEHRGLADGSSTSDDEGADDEEAAAPFKESSWQPSFNPEPSYTKPARAPPKKQHHPHRDKPASATYHHNLPYDGYPGNRYRQHGGAGEADVYDAYNGEEWHAGEATGSYSGHRPSDMYSNSTPTSSHRPKKTKGSSSSGSSGSSSSGDGHKKRQKKRRPSSSSSSSSSGGKGKGKLKHGKKSRSLETELRPPPAGSPY